MVELDLEAARRLVAAVDPTWSAQAVNRLSGGRNNSVFEVLTDEARGTVVKLYPGDWGWMMHKEAHAISLLHEQGVEAPVPEVLAADDSHAVVPHNCLVMSRLDGRHLGGWVGEVGEDEVVEFNLQAGGLLRALHALRLDRFGYLGADGVVDSHPTNAQYMRVQFEKKLGELDSFGGGPGLRRAVERYVRGREELLECPQACYCHNDCHAGNVLLAQAVDGLRVSGLVDFENVVAGDPLLDLAKTHFYSTRRTERTLSALASGYGELRAGWREAVSLYALYHALELWTWLASLGRASSLRELADDMRRLIAGEPLGPGHG